MNKKARPIYFNEKELVTIDPANPTIIEITVEGINSLPKNMRMLSINFITTNLYKKVDPSVFFTYTCVSDV